MGTKKGFLLLIVLLVLTSVWMGACAAPTVDDLLVQETEEPAVQVVETEEPVVEPTAEPTEEPAAELDTDKLDAAYTAFLAGMVRYNTITPAAVSEALVENPPFLLDVREVAEVEENGHIEGAVLIPLRELGKNIDKLPSFDTPVVAYCGSGWRCTIAMTALGALGYTDVKTMVGGSFGGWVEAGYPVVEGAPAAAPALNEAEPDADLLAAIDAALSGLPEGWGVLTAENLNAELIDGADLVLIDVRRPEEVETEGYIEGAVFVPLEQMIEFKDMWPAEDANIVIYCGVGVRGNIAATILRSYGYENVRNLRGGFGAWKDAGFEVVGGLDNAVQAFLDSMVAYNTITPQATFEALAEGQELFILDVRQVPEVEENGHIEGAVLIPLRELGKNIDKLPSFDTPIVAYCGSGWRCTIAMTALGTLGYTDIKTMVGGSFGGWVEAGYPVVEGVPADAPVLNEAEPDPTLLAAVDRALSGLPEGWGVLTVEDLNAEIIEGSEAVLVDVRKPEEVAEVGLIEGAVVVTLEEMVALKDQWPPKDANVVVYCKAGVRGNIAATILRLYGYQNVRNVRGGIDSWIDAGYPVVAQ